MSHPLCDVISTVNGKRIHTSTQIPSKRKEKDTEEINSEIMDENPSELRSLRVQSDKVQY